MKIRRLWVCRWQRSTWLIQMRSLWIASRGHGMSNSADLFYRYMDQQFSRYVNVSALKNLFNVSNNFVIVRFAVLNSGRAELTK
jgi:hypothetical protein